jgi:hypothetical protein
LTLLVYLKIVVMHDLRLHFNATSVVMHYHYYCSHLQIAVLVVCLVLAVPVDNTYNFNQLLLTDLQIHSCLLHITDLMLFP